MGAFRHVFHTKKPPLWHHMPGGRETFYYGGNYAAARVKEQIVNLAAFYARWGFHARPVRQNRRRSGGNPAPAQTVEIRCRFVVTPRQGSARTPRFRAKSTRAHPPRRSDTSRWRHPRRQHRRCRFWRPCRSPPRRCLCPDCCGYCR